MKLLLASATVLEIEPLLRHYGITHETGVPFKIADEVWITVTGIGMMATAFDLARSVELVKPDRLIQLGIAGSFSPQLELGQLVEVKSEQYGDLGVQVEHNIMGLDEIGLGFDDVMPDGELINERLLFDNLKKVNGLSVNKITSKHEDALRLKFRFNVDIETMEGIAAFWAGKKCDLEFGQLRAISNYVEDRDKSKWKMDEAIANLNDYMIKYLETV